MRLAGHCRSGPGASGHNPAPQQQGSQASPQQERPSPQPLKCTGSRCQTASRGQGPFQDLFSVAPASPCPGACLESPQGADPWPSLGSSVRHPKAFRGCHIASPEFWVSPNRTNFKNFLGLRQLHFGGGGERPRAMTPLRKHSRQSTAGEPNVTMPGSTWALREDTPAPPGFPGDTVSLPKKTHWSVEDRKRVLPQATTCTGGTQGPALSQRLCGPPGQPCSGLHHGPLRVRGCRDNARSLYQA